MVWTERGGPAVAPPTRKGFGTRLIERGLAAELGGSVDLAYAPEGVVCRIDTRLPHAAMASDRQGAVTDSVGEGWNG